MTGITCSLLSKMKEKILNTKGVIKFYKKTKNWEVQTEGHILRTKDSSLGIIITKDKKKWCDVKFFKNACIIIFDEFTSGRVEFKEEIDKETMKKMFGMGIIADLLTMSSKVKKENNLEFKLKMEIGEFDGTSQIKECTIFVTNDAGYNAVHREIFASTDSSQRLRFNWEK